MIWFLFLLLIAALLMLDLGVFHKKEHTISIKESLIWTSVWIALALLFGGVIYFIYSINFKGINVQNISPTTALIDYYTAYVIEKSLSLDNIFVIAMIFAYFKIDSKYQHNILFWGIIGAVIFRGIMIFLGIAFIQHFTWATYLFGLILMYSAYGLLKNEDESVDYSKSKVLQLISKIYPINWQSKGADYLVVENGKKYLTASFATLLVIEITDILFAIDSIPAVLAITTDSFIAFTSNIFAILGLRNLYFFLENMLSKFTHMKYSLMFILFFVGFKMLLANHYHISTTITLLVLLISITAGILFSLNNKTR